jgi:DNA modification methylase
MSVNGNAKHIKSIADLAPDQQNANRGTQRGRGLLEKSLRQYGAGRSVLTDRDGNVIAGNKTVDVAAQLDLPVRVVETDGEELVVVQRTDLDLDSSEGRGLAIADNRTGEMGLEWDTEALLDLSTNGIVDLEQFWKPDELDALLGEWGDEPAEDPGAQIDRADELRQKWGVESGQLWSLGDHRLICGDCTDADVVARLMDGEMAVLTVTDPPYGINYQSNYRKTKFMRIQNDTAITRDWIPIATQCTTGWIILFCAWQRLDEWLAVSEVIGKLTNLLVWTKKAAMGDLTGQFAPTFEVALAFARGAKLATGRRASAVFDVPIDASSKFMHPTQKPVQLFEQIIDALPAGVVYDPFLGSGTTLIACERLGRKCRAVEIAPGYVGVALERWAHMTGKQPQLN